MPPDLVCLGNLIVDDVVLADGRTRMGQPGGAMLYAALGACLWGTSVGIVAPLGDDYPASMLDGLAARGVDLAGLRPLHRQGLATWLLYERTERRILHKLGSPTHAEASPRPGDLPAAFADGRAFHLSPTPLASQAALVRELAARPGALVSVDPHDPVTEERFAEWRAVLENVDLFFASHEEVRLEGVARDPHRALRRLASGRLLGVALKRSERGGTFLDVRGDEIVDWRAHTAAVVDPTGAGDAFAGGFLSGWLEAGDLATSLERGVVSASFALEAWGSDGLFAATRDEAERRRREWFGSPLSVFART
jgi:ribokinase